MWATFRAAHPEVTLVLLPDAPSGGSQAPVGEAGPPLPPGEGHARASLDEAHAIMTALSRRLELIADVMKCADDGRVTGGWQQRGDGLVRPQRQLRALATESTPDGADMIAARLTQLGWQTSVRPNAAVAWVEGTTHDAFVRVTAIDGVITVRMTGDVLAVEASDAVQLLGEHGV